METLDFHNETNQTWTLAIAMTPAGSAVMCIDVTPREEDQRALTIEYRV